MFQQSYMSRASTQAQRTTSGSLARAQISSRVGAVIQMTMLLQHIGQKAMLSVFLLLVVKALAVPSSLPVWSMARV